MSTDIQELLEAMQAAREHNPNADLEAVVAEVYATEKADTTGDPFPIAYLNVATDTFQPGMITSALDPLTGWFPGYSPHDAPTAADLDSTLALGDVDRRTLVVLTAWVNHLLDEDVVGVALDAADAAERGFAYVFDGITGLRDGTGLPLAHLDTMTPEHVAVWVLDQGDLGQNWTTDPVH